MALPVQDRLISLPVARFEGLPLPQPFIIQVTESSTISDALGHIKCHLKSPELADKICRRLRPSTSTGKVLDWNSQEPVSSLLSSPSDTIVSLRLSIPLCGGKGGFGSQLRAAGGRMSSRKKKKQGEQNGSSRNLDGRRLRTITEAKALAEYLAIKPEMDKREKEERRQRWEQIVEMAEKKQEEIKNGGKGRLSGLWLEAKEDATEKTKDAVLAALQAGEIEAILEESDSEMSEEESEPSSSGSPKNESAESAKKEKPAAAPVSRSFYGWEEEEELSDSEDDEEAKKKD
jgi:Silencing defective 2 N-terminal ubiquitin domain